MLQATSWIADEHRVGYRKTPYIQNSNGVYRCLLCETGGMHRRMVSRHLEGRTHQAKLNHLKDAKNLLSAHEYCKAVLIPRIQKIRHDPWKIHIESLCFRSICNPSSWITEVYQIEKKLQQYEHREILLVLELAVWRTHLCDTMCDEMSIQQLQDRRNTRLQCGAMVIIQNVAPFLGFNLRF